jgi:hypothetical protein
MIVIHDIVMYMRGIEAINVYYLFICGDVVSQSPRKFPRLTDSLVEVWKRRNLSLAAVFTSMGA